MDLISCSSATSGFASSSQAQSASIRALIPLMLNVAIFTGIPGLIVARLLSPNESGEARASGDQLAGYGEMILVNLFVDN